MNEQNPDENIGDAMDEFEATHGPEAHVFPEYRTPAPPSDAALVAWRHRRDSGGLVRRHEVRRRWSNKCTGVSAAWCPIHGDCICVREGTAGLDDPNCPLHSLESTHAEVEDAPGGLWVDLRKSVQRLVSCLEVTAIGGVSEWLESLDAVRDALNRLKGDETP